MSTILLAVHIMVAASMILIILLQRSEGGALGMGGGGGFVTGRGAANLLTRMTAILAGIFFLTSLALGILGHRTAPVSAVGVGAPVSEQAPAENAPSTLPDLKLRRPANEAPPAPAQPQPAPATQAPAQPQVPQSH
jgi:preprotein translocase subunit SecG